MSARHLLRLSLAVVLLLATCTGLPELDEAPIAVGGPPTVGGPATAINAPTSLITTPTVSAVTIDPRPFNDARVRTALAYCTDRVALLHVLYPWIEDAAAYTVVISPEATGETAWLAGVSFAPDKGRALLERAGWTQMPSAPFRTAFGAPLALKLTAPESSDRRAWIAAWADQLAACGVQLMPDLQPAEWFYGAKTGLAAGEYQMAAFTRRADDRLDNAAVELPLFHRVEVFATHPQLENFAPPADGIHTRNAGEWRIPGRDTIIIGEDAEPAVPLESEEAYVARVVRALIEGGDSGAAGPYRITEWTYGSRMVLAANPQYTGPAPATPRIIIRFLPHDTVINALLKGQVDVLDLESLTPRDVSQFDLAHAAAAGTIRLLARPAAMWEVVRFAE